MTGYLDAAAYDVLAVTWSGDAPPSRLDRATSVLGPGPVTTTRSARAAVIAAGATTPLSCAPAEAVLCLTKGSRIGDRDVTLDDVRLWLRGDGRHEALDRVLPPFAALLMDVDGGTVRAATDYLGFRCLYSATGPGWSAVSTSTAALAVLSGSGLDSRSLAIYSLVGWRLADRTHYDGVAKLPPGATVGLHNGTLEVWARGRVSSTPVAPLRTTVREAAAVLRDVVGGALGDHPDSVLQLTGGLDSRILLAAVPPARRVGLDAMTLRVPGSADSRLAADLASRHGLRHRVVDLPDVRELAPAAARDLTLAGARRVEFSADPLAWASLSLIEDSVPQASRLSGLGGEVVRGFYYVGPPTGSRSTPAKVARLAEWRLFPNESVPDSVLEPGFAQWRRAATLDELEGVFATLPRVWEEATDAFYLWQRMQRWAAATATSTCMDRVSINPMLDPRFIAVGAQVPPVERAGMRFLSSILCELDPTLASLPLDGRPSPDVYANPGPVNRARLVSLTLRKAAGKARQRTLGEARPAAGGRSVADGVVAHWRSDPSDLDLVRRTGVVREAVLDQLVSGALVPGASTVGFLATIAAAEGATT